MLKPYKSKFKEQEEREYNPMAPEKEDGDIYYAVDLHNYRDAVHYLLPFTDENKAIETTQMLFYEMKSVKKGDPDSNPDMVLEQALNDSSEDVGRYFRNIPLKYNIHQQRESGSLSTTDGITGNPPRIKIGDDTFIVVGAVSGYSF